MNEFAHNSHTHTAERGLTEALKQIIGAEGAKRVASDEIARWDDEFAAQFYLAEIDSLEESISASLTAIRWLLHPVTDRLLLGKIDCLTDRAGGPGSSGMQEIEELLLPLLGPASIRDVILPALKARNASFLEIRDRLEKEVADLRSRLETYEANQHRSIADLERLISEHAKLEETQRELAKLEEPQKHFSELMAICMKAIGVAIVEQPADDRERPSRPTDPPPAEEVDATTWKAHGWPLRLREARKRYRHTQGAAAKNFGVSHETYRKWERASVTGKAPHKIQMKVLEYISNAPDAAVPVAVDPTAISN